MAALWTQPESPVRLKSCNLYSFGLYFERSKEMTIDIVVSRIPSAKLNQELWHLIMPHIQRCRSLSVNMMSTPGYARQQHIIQVLSSCSAPRLELLTITSNQPSAPSGHHLSIFSGGTPLLTHLALNRRASNLYLPSLQSVTTLALGITCSSELKSIPAGLSKNLQEMPLLVHLRLSDVHRWPIAIPLILPHLRTLYLDGYYYDGIIDVFMCSVHAPVLQELTAAARDYTGPTGPRSFYLPRNELIMLIEGDEINPFLSLTCLRGMTIHTNEVAPTDFRDQRHHNGPFVWSNIRSLDIPGTALNEELMQRLGIPHIMPIHRLGLSPEFVADGQRYALDQKLPFIVTEMMKSTPFPLESLECPQYLA
ncbi:hypothetical protein FIBSPDRAFT_964187 [Athelia psychrophila]|uniref:F-box domain-containing protein n=1 Tax=Athelia psychrophila TaxID=1759441 RepID=A0A165Y3S6_9AGAM|nr:hypothetical protein FIBSPDRAFT_964187 [Fibularhizoctonia sp. CBS 109695]